MSLGIRDYTVIHTTTLQVMKKVNKFPVTHILGVTNLQYPTCKRNQLVRISLSFEYLKKISEKFNIKKLLDLSFDIFSQYVERKHITKFLVAYLDNELPVDCVAARVATKSVARVGFDVAMGDGTIVGACHPLLTPVLITL